VFALDESDRLIVAQVKHGAEGVTIPDDCSGIGQSATRSGKVIFERRRTVVAQYFSALADLQSTSVIWHLRTAYALAFRLALCRGDFKPNLSRRRIVYR
jgi:hypothetical protein